MRWLNLPYPLLQSPKYKFLFALLSGIFVFVFLLVFQPFGSARLTTYKYLYLAGFGVSVFLGVATTYYILPQLFQKFFLPKKWTIGKEIVLQTSCILIICAFIYLHNTYLGRDIAGYQTYFNFLKITISVGVFPILGLIFFTERTLSKQNVKRAQELSNQLRPAATKETIKVLIQEESVKAMPIEMQLSDFVYAQSEGNYVTIYHLDNAALRHKLIRLSLKQLEIQLENLSQIKRFDGNARSLTIQLDHVATSIPVSRSFSKADFS